MGKTEGQSSAARLKLLQLQFYELELHFSGYKGQM